MMTTSPPENEPESEPEAPEVSTAVVEPKKAKKRERRTLLYPNHYSLRIREEDRERFDEYAYRHRLEKGAAFKQLCSASWSFVPACSHSLSAAGSPDRASGSPHAKLDTTAQLLGIGRPSRSTITMASGVLPRPFGRSGRLSAKRWSSCSMRRAWTARRWVFLPAELSGYLIGCNDGRQGRRDATRLVSEGARDTVRALAGTDAYVHARRRRQRIERVFGHLKRNLRLRTLKLRGLAGAAEKFTMAAAAYNLQLLARQAVPV
ncbi:transposase [Sphingomonas sp. BK481]|uniref:transposase n=1 Tax=Sphingomonas sp. BK481 TaxID=2586981 RepID=UPI0017D2C865|nr:transposase [Sphingomonas sp. BK481]MBB3589395.1 hypothetical protein [Sphingomonas sp. BK481]